MNFLLLTILALTFAVVLSENNPPPPPSFISDSTHYELWCYTWDKAQTIEQGVKHVAIGPETPGNYPSVAPFNALPGFKWDDYDLHACYLRLNVGGGGNASLTQSLKQLNDDTIEGSLADDLIKCRTHTLHTSPNGTYWYWQLTVDKQCEKDAVNAWLDKPRLPGFTPQKPPFTLRYSYTLTVSGDPADPAEHSNEVFFSKLIFNGAVSYSIALVFVILAILW